MQTVNRRMLQNPSLRGHTLSRGGMIRDLSRHLGAEKHTWERKRLGGIGSHADSAKENAGDVHPVPREQGRECPQPARGCPAVGIRTLGLLGGEDREAERASLWRDGGGHRHLLHQPGHQPQPCRVQGPYPGSTQLQRGLLSHISPGRAVLRDRCLAGVFLPS